MSASRLASAIARRLVGTNSPSAIELFASGVARQFGSGATQSLFASRVARGLASAVSKRLIAGKTEAAGNLVAALASQVGRKLTRSGRDDDLPVEEEAAAKK